MFIEKWDAFISSDVSVLYDSITMRMNTLSKMKTYIHQKDCTELLEKEEYQTRNSSMFR